MGRTPCCEKEAVKKGPWSPEEDQLLVQYIKKHGHGSWHTLPKLAGLRRCGKSCRLRWINYLRPGIKRGPFSPEEEATIIGLQAVLGNRWAAIASHLSGRTDNEIKNFWNTHLKKRLLPKGKVMQALLSPCSSEPSSANSEPLSALHMVQWENARLEAEARLSFTASKLSSPVKFNGDIYMKLWNSGVGEAFRSCANFGGKEGEATESATFAASSASKSNSVLLLRDQENQLSVTTASIDTIQKPRDSCKQELDMVAGSDSMSSDEFADSSDLVLKLLLDLPGELDFLQEQRGFF